MMRFRLRTLLIAMAIGPAMIASWHRGNMLADLTWILYSLIPPLLAATALGIWAKFVFWLLARIRAR